MEDLGYGGVVAGFADADFDPLLMSYHLAPGSPFSSLREAEGKEELKNAVGSKMGNFAMVQPLGYVMDLTDNESDDSWGTAAAGEKRQRGSRKRLSVYQVCCLEKWFKVDSKLEVRRKHQLAKELELKPRQVAIWFQNRRARHKKKQAEKEYGQIAEQYAMIKAQYDKVINENKKLKAQMKLMMEEMSLMEGSLLNYGKLMNAGLLNPRVMQQTQPELQQTFHINHNEFHNVCNGSGIIEQQVNSPVSSVFDSNSPVVTPKSQQLALADIWYSVAEPAEKINTNFMQAEQENSVNQNLFDLDDHNCFYSSQVDAPPASPCDFGVIPAADDPLWQFEL